MSETNYTADQPINKPEEDRFQRAGFAKRIANTISNRQDNANVVFGIYGAWGEGKSSVLNLIDKELAQDDKIIRIQFNPWRYGDEEALLQNYFDTIAKALNKSLHEWREKLGNWISRVTKDVKVKGMTVDWIGKLLSDVKLEELRERVNKFLTASEKKLVIFIDDIDRLDKAEIFAIFRLVKLTADFANTTYVLSFDEKMVAAAIGGQFGAGDVQAGERFLEKIIQIPLTIPKAQPAALLTFCSEQVSRAFTMNGLTLDTEKAEDFNETFSSYLLPFLTTPRLAIRYGNALSFALPLLQGEVNNYDLLLIEAVKIFFPDYYSFIKNNPQFFTSSYFLYENTEDPDKRNALDEAIAPLGGTFNKQQKNFIRNLLNRLFPFIDFDEQRDDVSNERLNFWRFHKRICSPDYFERYFTYTVLVGEVSDSSLEELLRQSEKLPIPEMIKKLVALIKGSNPADVMVKLLLHESELNWPQCRQLAFAIGQISELLPHENGTMTMFYQSVRMQGAIFIAQALKNHQKEPVFKTAQELLKDAKDIHFAYMINNRLRAGEKDDKLFNEEEYLSLANVFRERALLESQQAGLSLFEFFERFPDRLNYILGTWRMADREALLNYVTTYLDQQAENVISYLRAIIPMGINGSGPEYKTDLTQAVYDFATDIAGADRLLNLLFKVYPAKLLREDKSYLIEFRGEMFNDFNMAQQFVEWYDRAHSATDETNQS